MLSRWIPHINRSLLWGVGSVVGTLDLLLLPALLGYLLRMPHGIARDHLIVVPWANWAFLGSTPSGIKWWIILTVGSLAGVAWLAWRDGSSTSGEHGSRSGHAEYGSSRWRTHRELSEGFSTWKPGQSGPGGFVVGLPRPVRGRHKVSAAWALTRDEHLLIIGAPGSGKTYRLVLPTIGALGESGESLVISDSKGELYIRTAGLLARQGYRIERFDLKEPSRSIRWNPLHVIRTAIDDNRLSDATRMARELGSVLTADATPADDPFWGRNAESLVAALALAVAMEAPPGDRHLASVYHLLTTESDLNAWFDRLSSAHPARKIYQSVQLAAGETMMSIRSVTGTALALFGDADAGWLTSSNECDVSDPGRRPVARFLVIPDHLQAYYPLATLFLRQTVQELITLADRSGGRLPVRTHFILDEFGNLPALPGFGSTISAARSRGIRVLMVLQNLDQVAAKYDKTASTITGNCGTWVYLATQDPATARTISEKAGTATIQTTSDSNQWQSGQNSRSQQQGYAGRSLLTVDEVLRWPPDTALVLQERAYPAKLPLAGMDAWPWPADPAPPATARAVESPAPWPTQSDAPTSAAPESPSISQKEDVSMSETPKDPKAPIRLAPTESSQASPPKNTGADPELIARLANPHQSPEDQARDLAALGAQLGAFYPELQNAKHFDIADAPASAPSSYAAPPESYGDVDAYHGPITHVIPWNAEVEARWGADIAGMDDDEAARFLAKEINGFVIPDPPHPAVHVLWAINPQDPDEVLHRIEQAGLSPFWDNHAVYTGPILAYFAHGDGDFETFVDQGDPHAFLDWHHATMYDMTPEAAKAQDLQAFANAVTNGETIYMSESGVPLDPQPKPKRDNDK